MRIESKEKMAVFAGVAKIVATFRPEPEPAKRRFHESALVDGRLYVFGGVSQSKFVARNEIWIFAAAKWLRRSTRGRTIPPPCKGARCVAIDDMIYSYGGETENGRHLGNVYRLDPRTMKWIEVATPIDVGPSARAYCCLCVIGSRLIMFGGESETISPDRLQRGATQDVDGWNDEIYEFEFMNNRQEGFWSTLELGGRRPSSRHAAMATIDRHRAFLFGASKDFILSGESFVIDLQNNCWTVIDFDVTLSLRRFHTICQLSKREFKEKSLCLLIGGQSILESESVYLLDIDDRKVWPMGSRGLRNVSHATSHCVQNEDKTTDVLVYHENGLEILHLDSRNESYMKIEQELLSSSPIERQKMEIERLRRECARLKRENVNAARATCAETTCAEDRRRCEEQIVQMRREMDRERADGQRHFEEERLSFRRQLDQRSNEISRLREENAVTLIRCQNLEASREEMKKRLDVFLNVLTINPDEIHVTEQTLGSGAFAGVRIGLWRGMRVAVKKFHEVLANPRNLELFRREVLVSSRLHHPNIMTICGAVMREDVPFQMVMELLEGSVSEVMNATHTTSSGSSYLTFFEQLSIALDVTSAIAYLHQTHPKPYVHGDIRPSNVLVTRDMKAKVGDLGATHIIESSLSVGPLSPDYLASERKPRDGTAIRNTLPSDVYSLGVSLIEIFTGARPIPEERQTQLGVLANRPKLFLLCSRMIDDEADNRPSSQHCFDTLREEIECVLLTPGFFTVKRLVKGVFERNAHRVVLSLGVFY